MNPLNLAKAEAKMEKDLSVIHYMKNLARGALKWKHYYRSIGWEHYMTKDDDPVQTVYTVRPPKKFLILGQTIPEQKLWLKLIGLK